MSDATEPTPTVARPTLLRVGVGVVVVVAVLLGWFLRRGDTAPGSPRAAAQQWADAVLDHRADDQIGLQCRRVIHTELDTLPLTAPGADGIVAGAARMVGSGEWRVPLQTRPAGTGTTFTVTVVRRGPSYLACDQP